ncbi:hypothetical protein GCM10012275_41170 [Longimycelium tulufanense]|uniref:Uncharacterized protein n=1 Tax=Longimycelium tulufanense TaxID=907463 RepID=A0A8J3CGQ4_9PSEU|nr:hypothetical protein [Longimycelium tulufanense]GGM66399.1 hypothetical protein GCM10012275_41170 [Longimycelium tulufanense]
MDPRERADELLARARARGGYVVTPDDATSPMDAANTVQIPRIVVDANDPRNELDPDSTVVLPTAQTQAFPPVPPPQAGQQGVAPQHPGMVQQGHPAAGHRGSTGQRGVINPQGGPGQHNPHGPPPRHHRRPSR